LSREAPPQGDPGPDRPEEEAPPGAAAHEEGRLLANRAFLLAASKIIGTAFNMGLFVLLSYTFSREEYGQFRQVWMINRALALEIFTLGIPGSIYFFLPRLRPEQRRHFVRQSLNILTVAGLVVTAGVLVFADLIADAFDTPALASLLRIFCLFPLLTLPTVAVEGILVSIDRTRAFALATIVERVAMFVTAAIAIVAYGSVTGVLVAIVVFAVLRLAGFLLLLRRALRDVAFAPSGISIGKQIRFALPLGLSGIVNILNVELDKLIIASAFSAAQFARYANGAFDIPLVGSVASAISSVMMPEFSRAQAEDRVPAVMRIWNRTVVQVGLLFIPLMSFLFFFATDFITLVFSEKYADSVVIFQIYLIAMIPKIVWYGTVLVALGHSREPLIGSTLALATNLTLNLILIEWLGFTGPAIATVITTFILFGYYVARLRSLLGLSLRDVFPWRAIGAILGLTAGLALVTRIALSPFSTPNYVRLGVGGVTFYALALPLLWRTGLLGRTEIDYVVGYVRKVVRILRAGARR
jgi:O-antigen/teichoic acid export membrane protein